MQDDAPGSTRKAHTTSGHEVVQRARDARSETAAIPPARTASGRLQFDKPAPFPLSVRIAKRTIDIVGSLVALIVGAPLYLAVAAAVKLTSKGPVFYHQLRVRHVVDGAEETFRMHKFRTMVVNAEALSGPVWAGKRDPRITPIGRILRKSRLDEIPQFWNVLKGEMSIVGPRPERPHFTSRLQGEIPVYYDRAMMLKPGITGWAQVRCPYDESMDSVRTKLLYDLAYAAHCYRLTSYLKMEIQVMFLTVAVIFTGKGAQ